jgi:hypothetical protein
MQQSKASAESSNYDSTLAPGYRVYFGKDGEEIILLLGGGTKKRQQKDIEQAKYLWNEYKAAKRGKEKGGTS